MMKTTTTTVTWSRVTWSVAARAPLLLLLVLLLLLQRPQLAEGICPPQCTCNDETLVVTCNNHSLTMVPITLNPGVKQLSLTGTSIKNVVAAFSFYNDLEYLDLSRNQLSSIDTRAFETQGKLLELRLSHNNIEKVVNDTFYGLAVLKVLHLNNNDIQVLPAGVFMHLKSLEDLDVSFNHISSLSNDSFLGLAALRSLSLFHNLLQAVPSSSFNPLPGLHQLDLGQNKLGRLPAGAFRSLKALQSLSLDGCGLQDVPSKAFEGGSNGAGPSANLRVLRIQNNSLYSIPANLSVLERLEEIEVGDNPLHELPKHAFSSLRRLRVIDITGAGQLEVIRANAFSDMPSLEKLRISYNPHLSVIETGSFEGASSLRHLSLRSNALATFSETLLTWDDLDSLDLRDNPLQCNCSLLWLRNLLHMRNLSSPGVEVATCDGPSRLHGRSVAQLDVDELSCYFTDVRQQAIVGVVAAVVVACVATLVLVVLKYRKRVTTVLKDQWSDGALRRKEHQYEKTNDEEENNILHAAAQQSLKMTPVTEL